MPVRVLTRVGLLVAVSSTAVWIVTPISTFLVAMGIDLFFLTAYLIGYLYPGWKVGISVALVQTFIAATFMASLDGWYFRLPFALLAVVMGATAGKRGDSRRAFAWTFAAAATLRMIMGVVVSFVLLAAMQPEGNPEYGRMSQQMRGAFALGIPAAVVWGFIAVSLVLFLVVIGCVNLGVGYLTWPTLRRWIGSPNSTQ